TGFIALLIGIPTLKLHGHYLVMATLGFNIIINIITIQWDQMTGGPSGFPGIPNLKIGSLIFDSDRKMYYLIWFFTFVGIFLALNLVHSRVGRGLRALHGSEVAARSLGVKTEGYKVKVFIISALYASLAGSLYAHYLTFISPKTFDIFFSIEKGRIFFKGKQINGRQPYQLAKLGLTRTFQNNQVFQNMIGVDLWIRKNEKPVLSGF
ncbi:MAG: hypothetical protein V2B13_16325, partial [Pseudomonadota bacterium]